MSTRVLCPTLLPGQTKAAIAALTFTAPPTSFRKAGKEVIVPPPPPIKLFRVDEKDKTIVHIPLFAARWMKVGIFSPDESVRAANRAIQTAHRKFVTETGHTASLRPGVTLEDGTVLNGQVEAMRSAAAYMFGADDPRAQGGPKTVDELAIEFKNTAEVHKNGLATGGYVAGMPPGFGKTLCTTKSVVWAGLFTLVVANREHIVKQWAKTFADYTTLRVLVWTAAASKKAATAKGAVDWSSYDVVVSMDTIVDRIPMEVRDQFGTLVLDEAHQLCVPSRTDLYLTIHPKFIIACSATLVRDDGMHAMVHAITGPHGIYIDNQIRFTLYRVSTPYVPFSGNEGVEWSAVTHSLSICEPRNLMLANLTHHLVSVKKRKVLLMTYRVDHAAELERRVRDRAGDEFSVSGFFGLKKSYNDADVLVGSLQKTGTGFDEANMCEDWKGTKIDTLILCTSIASFTPLIQAFGRAFRADNPEVYYIVDKLGTIERHYSFARKYALDGAESVSATADKDKVKKGGGTGIVKIFDAKPFLPPKEVVAP